MTGYTLDTENGLCITVWTYGATLTEVLLPDRNGAAGNVVLRCPDLASYEERHSSYIGATMGRFARCIAEGRFSLDGVEYQLDRNIGRHHFHGGGIGFDRFVWDAAVEEAADRLTLRLRLERPDGDQGYPGAITAETAYTVDADRRLTIEYGARTTAPTIVALTNHSFWNLAGSGTIAGHRLAINAARVLVTDDEFIPTGPPRSAGGTRLDFTTARPIGDERLDHCFALDEAAWAAELYDPGSGRTMHVRTDQPGLAVYSADHLEPPRSGICLQTGAWPDAPNQDGFPRARLDPGDRYTHRTVHQFSTR